MSQDSEIEKHSAQRLKKTRVLFFILVPVSFILLAAILGFQLLTGDPRSIPSALIDKPVPQFSLLPEPNPTRPVIIADADTDAGAEEGQSEISENDGQIISQSDEDEADLDLSPMLSGWSIRLGSFAEKQNATNLVERLHESEYKAYTREFNNSAGELVSVFVGPWIDKSIAEDYLSELEDKFRLAGDIVRYEVGSF